MFLLTAFPSHMREIISLYWNNVDSLEPERLLYNELRHFLIMLPFFRFLTI